VPDKARRAEAIWRILRASLCTFALVGPIGEYAHSQVSGVEQFHHTSWTVENGLSAVFAVQQAPDGFLWLTTAKGVFRFDGVRFESLDEVTNGAVHNAEIEYAYASPSGNIWLTTVNSGLLLWKNNTVTRYPDRRCTPAQAKTGNIVEDDDGTLWIAGSSGLYRLRNGTCEAIHNKPEFPAGFPWAILLDRAGTLWVKWPVSGLYFLPRGHASFEQTSAGAGASGQRAFLKQAPDGSIWLSDLGGLRRVAGSSDVVGPRTSPSNVLSPPPQFGDFTFSPDGSLWAASATGLNRFASVKQYKMDEPLGAVDSQAFTVKQGLSSSVVSDLLPDK
jgi:ligand-binding sensor domain-containing protein